MARYRAGKRSHGIVPQTVPEGRRSSPDDRGHHPSQIRASMPRLLRLILISIIIIGVHMVGTLVNACPSI